MRLRLEVVLMERLGVSHEYCEGMAVEVPGRKSESTKLERANIEDAKVIWR